MIVSVTMAFSFRSAPLEASARVGEATEAIRSKVNALIELSRETGPEAESRRFALFDQIFNATAFSESSLGSEWQDRTDAEKGEFGGLIKQLVQKAWMRNLKKIAGHTIDYLDEESRANNEVIVQSKAKSKTDPREDPVSLSYKMRLSDGSWRVHDFVVEEVSSASAYRSQFTKIIKKDGFAVLLQKMKDKISKEAP